MAFSRAKLIAMKVISENWKLWLFLTIFAAELSVIHQISDLPVSIGGWIEKAQEISSFKVPQDNFYGPGAAILIVPFLWLKTHLFLILLIYSSLGALGYWKITNIISNEYIRRLSKSALLANFYLIWLINSSQDTVFEFFLLMWAMYFLLKKNYIWFSTITFLLCLTRAGYWVFFLGSAVVFFLYEKRQQKNKSWKTLLAIPLLIFSSLFNYTNYHSLSPALESGITAYYSYSKYHYLALPKMDMDVFLSGPNGAFSKNFGPLIVGDEKPADVSKIYRSAAIDSLLNNKKETILAWMQKFDSYFFDVQKVPHLPGSYVLDQQEMKISIQDERLTWPLILGNLFYLLYRTLLFSLGMLAAGILIGAKFFLQESRRMQFHLWPTVLPYLFGVIPGILFYTETRFKIVSELLIIPIIAQVWSCTLRAIKRNNRQILGDYRVNN